MISPIVGQHDLKVFLFANSHKTLQPLFYQHLSLYKDRTRASFLLGKKDIKEKRELFLQKNFMYFAHK